MSGMQISTFAYKAFGQALSVDSPGPSLCVLVLVQGQAPTSASIAQRVAVVCTFEGSDAPQADTLHSLQVRACLSARSQRGNASVCTQAG